MGNFIFQWTTAGAPTIVRSGPVAIVHSEGGAPAIASTPVGEPPAPEVEERLKEMEMRLPEAARQALAARLALPKSFDDKTPQPLGAIPPRPARRALLRAATTDPRKAARDQENAKALCAAFGRNLLGAPNACATVPWSAHSILQMETSTRLRNSRLTACFKSKRRRRMSVQFGNPDFLEIQRVRVSTPEQDASLSGAKMHQ